jgi:hypothetical protein
MKINWGTGIAITLALFLIGMISLVIISSKQELNLVTPDYYPKGVNYQQMIDKTQRTQALEEGLSISQTNDQILIKFPRLDSISKPKGTVLLFFPIDYRLDKEKKIVTDSALIQQISKDSLLRGTRCIFKIEWVQNGEEYYTEQTLIIN